MTESFTPPADIAHRPVAVVGAGTLGRRIALVFGQTWPRARAGYGSMWSLR